MSETEQMTHRQSHRTRAEERAEEIDVRPTTLLAEIERLKGELEAARRQADEYLAGLQRERAEFQNYKRRVAEERERELGLAGEDLIRKVLALADDFDRAIETRPAALAGDPWAEGIAAIDRKLRALLESEGVAAIDASAGRRFDPREHDAIANVPGTAHPEGAIVEEVRRGYRLRDRVIRPALVLVAAPAAEGTPSGDGAAQAQGDRDASAASGPAGAPTTDQPTTDHPTTDR